MTLDILFPVALSTPFSYHVETTLSGEALVGRRALVGFGKADKPTIGIIVGYRTETSDTLKDIIAVDNSDYRLPLHFIQTLSSKASYYFVQTGDVLKSSLPSDFWNPKAIDFGIPLNGLLEQTYRHVPFELSTDQEQLAFYSVQSDSQQIMPLSPKEKTFFAELTSHRWTYFNLATLRQHKLSKPLMDRCVAKGALVSTEFNRTIPQQLNPEQTQCATEIRQIYASGKTEVLLHGITGSGKTHLFLDLINEEIGKNPQATILYLLPEIAITSQLILRLQKALGSIPLLAFHSQITAKQKNQILKAILSQRDYAVVIIGARSSALLPYASLDLIIVDEEHERNYKQTDKTPRYNVHEWIQWTAKALGTKVLLGSATPSIESYAKHKERHSLVTLNSRHSKQVLPQITLLDKPSQEVFSPQMIEEIQLQLDQQAQTIIYLNRRGYTPIVKCNVCHHIYACPHCDITMTYHADTQKLNCHHCTHSVGKPRNCSQCGSADLDFDLGIGTQKVEQELEQRFPTARVLRMDSDTVSSKTQLQLAVQKIQNREVDIIIGTQLISKGFDFEHITLVGILNIDAMLHFSDFRARERTFQQMVQVAGRAGRGARRGRVLIQTHHPEDHTIQQVIAQDYLSLYLSEMQERKQYDYPPFVRLCCVTLTNISEAELFTASLYLQQMLERNYTHDFQGPCTPSLKKVQSQHRVEFWFKWSTNPKLYIQQHQLLKEILKVYTNKIKQPKLKVIVDVDPK